MRKSIIIAFVSLLLFSCNLDSSQGVYQKVFNDTATNYEKIQSVLGEIDGNLIIYANLDLYAFDGESMERIAKLPKNASYVPFMAVGNSVFFSNRNADGSYTFFSATLDEAAAGIDEGFIPSNEVEVTLPSGSSSEIVNFSGLNNFTMDETQVLYTLSSDNAGAAHPDELVTHYGFITRSEVSADGFAIKGGAEVHASSSIIGKRIARVYAEDSDMSIGDNVLSDINGFYRLSDDGAVAVFYEFESSRDIDYDNLVIGADSEYFIENQTGRNAHDEINKTLSAAIIKSHVKLGVEKGKEIGLPQEVIDIISEHHGNDLIKYFYNEAVREAKENMSSMVSEEDFRYNGRIPATVESAVVMLADCTEAATRTMKNPNHQKYDKFINGIMMDKINYKQLNNSQLTINDLEKIKESFIHYLLGRDHQRIEYGKD